MYGWGYKCTWVATTAEPAALVDALGLDPTTSALWGDGVAAAEEGGVFVTPTLDGWTFAVGDGLGARAPDVEVLARQLGHEVQVFASHRVVDLASWMRAGPGIGVRRFTWVGDQGELTTAGSPTEIERQLGIDRFTAAIEADDWDAVDEWPGEETVLEVAADWSRDPRTFDDLDLTDAEGVLGRHVPPPGSAAKRPGRRWGRAR